MTTKALNVFLTASVLALCATACSKTEFTTKTQLDPDVGERDVDREPVTIGGEDADPNDDPGDVVVMPDVPGDGRVEGEIWVPSTGDFVIRDQQTGTLWNLRGQAFEGPLKDTQLAQLPSFNAFWFAWSIFHHGSEIWNKDEVNLPGEIMGEGNCLVPCDEIRLGCSGGRDCIPALDYDGRDNRPEARMVEADAPEAEYLSDTDTVLGIYLEGEARAYSHNLLWWHEIYNDRIGNTEFSASLCPLTGSGIVFAGDHDGGAIDFGVSGNLYNSNLVMFDRDGDTLWSQMMLKGVSGPRIGEQLRFLPVTETTWGRWRQMHPDTLVASDQTGYRRNYNSYPYGDYRTNHGNTFRPTNPRHQGTYEAKDLVMGMIGETTKRAYAFVEMEAFGDRVVINDNFEGGAIVVVYEAEHQLSVPFSARVGDQNLTFEGATAP